MRERIIFVLPSNSRSGGSDTVLRYANDLASKCGFETYVTTISNHGRLSREFGDAFVYVPMEEALAAEFSVAIATHWSTVEPTRLLRARRWLLFAQSMEDRFFAAHEFMTQQEVLAAQSATHAITVAPWLSEELEALSGHRAITVRNPLPEEVFASRESSEPLPLIVVEGSWQWFKGWDEALQVLELIGTPVRVALVSSDGLLPSSRVRRLSSRLGAERVSRFDQLGHADFLSLLREADVLLKTSCIEGSPLPHVEALAAQCVVISTLATGVDMAVIHGCTGLIADFGDAQGTANLVDLVLHDRELWTELSVEGLRLARQAPKRAHSTEQFAEALAELTSQAEIDPKATQLAGDVLNDAWVRYAQLTFSTPRQQRVLAWVLRLARSTALMPISSTVRNTRVGRVVQRKLR